MSSISDRLDRRIELLSQIVEEGSTAIKDASGVEVNVDVPLSLTKCRKWNLPALGIEPIADPNSFTTKHPRHGHKVREIEGLIARLPKDAGRPRKLSATAEAAMLRRQLAGSEALVAKLTGQLSAINEELRVERALRLQTEEILRRELRRKDTSNKRGSHLKLVEDGHE